jgi:formiminotetrahydrofolate cyclodeaminase
MLADKTTRELLAAFASSDPTPGGGSASALASATGAALLIMVAALPRTRNGSADDREALDRTRAALVPIQARLTDAIDADTTAYERVVAAYKQPKATEQEQAARKAAIETALRAATDVPLQVMRLSEEALRQSAIVASRGYKAAASDIGVAIALIGAGLHGARLNVDINLGSIADAAYKGAVEEEARRLEADGGRSANDATAQLEGR